MKLVSHLSSVDRSVLAAVQLLEQATSGQLERLCFSQPDLSERSYGVRTRGKLLSLYNRGHLRRFASIGTGGWVYLPGNSRATKIDHHTLDVSELYVRLVEASRLGMCQILEWTVREKISGKKEDDIYLWLQTPFTKQDWHVEIDRGSEFKPQLQEKMRAYMRAIKQAKGSFPGVLYIVTFDPRKTLEERRDEIKAIAMQQDEPDWIEVVTIHQAVGKFVGG